MNWSRPRPMGRIFFPSRFCAGWASVLSYEERKETGPGVLTLICLSYLFKLSEHPLPWVFSLLILKAISACVSLSLSALSRQGTPLSPAHTLWVHCHVSWTPQGPSWACYCMLALATSINSLCHKWCLSKLVRKNANKNHHTIDCCKHLDKYKVTITRALWRMDPDQGQSLYEHRKT